MSITLGVPAILVMLVSATLAGVVLGACATVAYHRLHPDATVTVLRAELQMERAGRRMAEHRLSFWIGLREVTVIAVDLRKGDG